jgi:hypothetical protein
MFELHVFKKLTEGFFGGFDLLDQAEMLWRNIKKRFLHFKTRSKIKILLSTF